MSESSEHNDQEHGLRTEPSFCIYNGDDDKFGGEADNMEKIQEKMERSATIGESIEAEFSFGGSAMRIIEEDEDEDEDGEEEEEDRAPDRFENLRNEVETGASKLRNHAQYLEVGLCHLQFCF